MCFEINFRRGMFSFCLVNFVFVVTSFILIFDGWVIIVYKVVEIFLLFALSK